MRTTVVATAIEIQDAEVADELLSFLANCDDTAAHQELLERARERLATEDRHVVMVDVLSAW